MSLGMPIIGETSLYKVVHSLRQLWTRPITTNLIADGAVTTTKIADGAVTVAKLTTLTGTLSFSGANDLYTPIFATMANSGNLDGPFCRLFRDSDSPAVSDPLGAYTMDGNNSADELTLYAMLRAFIVDPTDGSEDGELGINTIVGGSLTESMRLAAGAQVGAPTGGDKGVGTLNATAVYDDNVLLTDIVGEWQRTGNVDLAKWDAMVPDRVTRASKHTRPVMETVTEAGVGLVQDADGSFTRKVVTRRTRTQVKVLVPVYDEEGRGVDAVEVPLTETVETPERREPRQHYAAHLFAAMVADGWNPRDPVQYIAKMRERGALPGMPNEAEWEHGKYSIGELHTRSVLAMELLAVAFEGLAAKVAALEAGTP